MVPVCVNLHRSLGQMAQTFRRLGEQAADLGLSLSVWDSQVQLVGQFHPASEFCRKIHGASGPCVEAHRQVAGRVISDGWAVTSASDHGCCLLGVPVYQRRRLCGAVVGSYPTASGADEHVLGQLCDKLGLDRSVVSELARQSRRSAVEAQDFLAILRWLLEANQAVDTADHEIAALTANLARTYEELSLVYRISGSMQVTQRPESFLGSICDELVDVMSVESAAAIIYPHAATMQEDLVVVSGDLDLDHDEIRKLASSRIVSRFENHLGPVLDNKFAYVHGGDSAATIQNFVAVPLAPDKPIGLLVAFDKIGGDFDSFDLKLISSIGNQAAVFLANSRLYADLQDLLMGVLHALTSTVDAKDPYTAGHSQRVAMLSRRLAQECGYPPEKVQQLYLAGLLHDIGKVGVPEATLQKQGKLTDEEYDQIKRHPAIGAAILGGIRQLEHIIIYILTHHERPDGRGYPRGLAGDEIPREGLIVGLADSFDAMTSARTYRKALSIKQAAAELLRYSGLQFDSALVETFLAMDLEQVFQDIRESKDSAMPDGFSWQPDAPVAAVQMIGSSGSVAS